MDLLERMNQIKSSLPGRRRKACQYILDNPLITGNMSLQDLAEKSAVGTATIIRLVTENLGFDSFTSFKKELRNVYISHQENNYAAYQQHQTNLLKTMYSGSHVAAAILDSIPDYLHELQTPEFWNQIECAVRLLLGAKRIFILGLRSAMVPAQALEMEIDQITGNAVQLSTLQEQIFDRVMTMTNEDILFVFSNWPCTQRTIDVAEFAYNRGVPFILETNASKHPLIAKAAAVINSGTVNRPYHMLPTILMIEILAHELRSRVTPISDALVPEMLNELNATGYKLFYSQNKDENDPGEI